MKKYWHIALMLFCVLMITSCGDDDEALEVDEVCKEPIYYTSKVECYYKGSFINGEVFDDRSFEAGEPAVMEVYKMTDGFATALQNMHPGDKWEIWVPSQLGYGEAGYKNPNTGAVVVKPCTTMIFEMEVVGIVEE